jgi:prepilin-type N-terminal cleavage/methylation domain-containing protein
MLRRQRLTSAAPPPIPVPVTTRRAFTLLELLVVVVVLAALAALAIPRFATARDSARDATARAGLRSALSVALAARAAGGSWPDAVALGADSGLSTTSGSAAPGTISVAVVGDAFVAATVSATGTCFRVRTDATGVPTWSQDTATQCAAHSPWNPSMLGSALALWLDADDPSSLTLDGTAVVSWRDRSANGLVVGQTTPADRPGLVGAAVAGRPVVRFDATNEVLRSTTTSPLSGTEFALSAFAAVVRRQAALDYSALVAQTVDAGGSGLALGLSAWGAGGGMFTDHWEPGGRAATAGVPPLGQPSVVGWVIPRWADHRSGTTMRMNGTALATTAYGGTAVNGLGAGPLLIGNWKNSRTDMQWPGDIGELVLVRSALSTADAQRLEAYLAHRWGAAASLPADHPHRAAPPLLVAPGAPGGMVAIGGDGRVHVAWSAPSDGGGSPVTDYVVQRRPAPDGAWTTVDDGVSASTETTVSGLSNGTASEFRVAAVNSVGRGAWSSTVSATPLDLWTPADLGGTTLWLDATDPADFTLAGDAVVEWRDRSGNGRHVGQTNPSARPVRVAQQLNTRAVVRWGTTYQQLVTTQTVSLGDFDAFVVFRDTGTEQYERLIDHGYVNGFWLGRDSNAASSWRSGVQESAVPYGRAVSLADGAWHILQTRRSGTTHAIRGNGGTPTTGTVPGVATTAHRIGIGAWADGFGDQFLRNGSIAEVLIVPRALTDVERERVEGYLAHRWGLTANLPSGHPFRATPPLG